VAVLNEIELQIKEVKKTALDRDVRPEQLRDDRGNWVMSPLLLAKVQALHTLVQLQSPK
jgi:hypothetical protein